MPITHTLVLWNKIQILRSYSMHQTSPTPPLSDPPLKYEQMDRPRPHIVHP